MEAAPLETSTVLSTLFELVGEGQFLFMAINKQWQQQYVALYHNSNTYDSSILASPSRFFYADEFANREVWRITDEFKGIHASVEVLSQTLLAASSPLECGYLRGAAAAGNVPVLDYFLRSHMFHHRRAAAVCQVFVGVCKTANTATLQWCHQQHLLDENSNGRHELMLQAVRQECTAVLEWMDAQEGMLVRTDHALREAPSEGVSMNWLLTHGFTTLYAVPLYCTVIRWAQDERHPSVGAMNALLQHMPLNEAETGDVLDDYEATWGTADESTNVCVQRLLAYAEEMFDM